MLFGIPGTGHAVVRASNHVDGEPKVYFNSNLGGTLDRRVSGPGILIVLCAGVLPPREELARVGRPRVG